ncbi:Serine/threonine-protein kinase smg1 [Gamsiella multidivaricata]|nr:Serine/threonine-protein kinase smg1 [Gamsiella multidivaricata]
MAHRSGDERDWFGQDLLEYFIKDIDTVIMDSTPSDLLSSIDIIRLLLSSFDIIAKALIAHASQELDRIVHIQQRAVSTLTSIRKLSSSLDAAGNEIILALSLAEPSTFYNQQPVAIHYLASQFENTQIDNATWTQKITILRKILAAWKPRMHPNVTLEAVHPKGDLMRLRWLLPMKSTCAQDLLDIILLCVPGPAVGASLASHEYADTPLQTWSSVMYEVDAILQSLALGNCLSETESLGSVIEAAEAARKNELENSRLIGTKYHGTQRADCRRTGASTNTSISNMTFDILLLVEMAKLWPSEADLIFIRLLGTLDIVPESRLAIVIQALREISASQEHFIPDWLNVAPATSIDTNSLDVTTAGISLKAVQTLVAHWKLFPLSIKLCIVIWGSGILQAMRPYRDASSASRSWVILKRAISSNLHQLITIAGADEDELVRGSIAIIFESFIGTFGSFSLGPQFLATMTDRSLDISPIAGAVWKRVAFQANPFSFAFQCYDIPETDIIRALKTLVLRSPNSGVFRYPHFSTVFSALAAAEENLELIDVADNESTGFPQDGDMLQRLFHSCQGQDILAKVNSEYGTELQFYNAQQGTALGVIPLAPKPSIMFVRSNKKMLDDWLSRIRSRVVAGARAIGEHEIIIRNGYMNRYEQSAKEAMSLMGSFADNESAPANFLCQGISNSLSDLYSYQQLQKFMDSISIETFAKQTMLWSDDTLTLSLKEYCSNEGTKAWKYLEGFYGTFGKERTTPDMFAFDRSGLVGRNYLFATKVHQQSGLQPIELDRIRQQALHILEPSAEFLMYNGLEHASATLLDAMMLKTATSATPLALKEFMDQLALVPDELRMNMFHKDLRYWVRLDALVNLAKRQVLDEDSLVRKQSNEFKFLLSKIARRSECHDFASSITRTWEGALSPEIQFEEAKAAVAKHDYSAALSASNRILGRIQSSTQTAGGDQTMAVFQSKIYLKMAKWSRSTKPQLSEGNIMAFEDILSLEHETTHSVQARVESITATCLQKAIEVGTNYRKSWFAYGTHHYKQGWGILDELGSFRFHHPVAMVANDTLKSILERSGVEKLEEHSKDIFCVFVKHCASGQPFDEPTVYESIRVHLLKIDEIAASENAMVEIVKLFQTLLQQILEAYRLAIHGYFRFLQFAALEFECHKPKTKTTSGEEEAEIELSHLAVSDEITATLRLLRLLAKHGGQLYDAFHENLVGINVSPWANIIPQLFARLDHPEKPVQTLIADLLCKIGEQYPQLIVFHCVVGANSAHNSACQRRLLCSIGDFLNKSHPELVLQVQHLIRELERITVLWEEVWYKKMMAGLPELKNTLQELTEQYQGLDAISGLSVEDKDAVMSDNYQQSVIPLLATFESLQDSNATPESNHERWFISMFRSRIQEALECLRSPKAWSNLFEGLGMLKEIYIDLGKELSGTRVLQLSNLSPELASIQSSLIDIPSPSHESGVTIQSFEQQVVVIPTKTKPKKLTLVGSDGKRYTYLFKGLEDLHLDERVMQLLRITNGMLQRDKESNSRQLSARHYAVVPLSDNSGMIQWVENTVSIFTIIAKWQHRELMWARWMNDDTPAGTHQAPQRATEIYHEKAAAALKRAGQPSNLPRRQWPKSMLLDLYHEMANETPADLLEREIWTSSPTAEEWWRKSVRFARSTAVMSMIGYVIGLGDRHLDNILIDFTTGDLVHIDYNVCFEKGKRLRIPEIVPFRLSRNMLTSLGVTGVEGNFRIGCEQTMKVMRKNKEILVTLLEAFVYDPLVDWQIEATAPQGGAGGAGVDVGQGHPREGHHGLAAESESESSNISGVNQQDSRSSFDNSISTRSRSSRRRMSNESLASISSISIKSTATVDSSSKRWSTTGGDQAELTPSLAAMNLANGTSVNQAQQQQHQGQQIQPHQRNAYAVHILRRVRHKLEGRDFEAVKKCKVTEQVDRVIQEATSVDNLANMYEGWTPWL